MKGKKKQLLGLLGLFLVAAITTFAVLMPQQGVSATHSESITDTIEVRVVGSVPKVTFTSPESGTRFTEPNQTVGFDYENVTDVDLHIEYTNPKGESSSYDILGVVTGADYQPGSGTYDLNLDRYGYGDYKITVRGHGYGAENITEDVIEFHYDTESGGISGGDIGGNGEQTGDGTEDNPFTGDIVVNPGVDPNDTVTKHVEICVRYEDGRPVDEMCPLYVDPPFGDVTLPFEEKGMPSGWYTVELQAYDDKWNPVGEPKTFRFYYKGVEANVPDTGAPFANLNISRQDYLLTGLIIFVAAAVLGIVFVLRRKATAKRNKR